MNTPPSSPPGRGQGGGLTRIGNAMFAISTASAVNPASHPRPKGRMTFTNSSCQSWRFAGSRGLVWSAGYGGDSAPLTTVLKRFNVKPTNRHLFANSSCESICFPLSGSPTVMV
jgi:hypothetical protein